MLFFYPFNNLNKFLDKCAFCIKQIVSTLVLSIVVVGPPRRVKPNARIPRNRVGPQKKNFTETTIIEARLIISKLFHPAVLIR